MTFLQEKLSVLAQKLAQESLEKVRSEHDDRVLPSPSSASPPL